MNKHHPRWETSYEPYQCAQNLVDICNVANSCLANTPNTLTSYPINHSRPAMLDLTFFNQDQITGNNWDTDLEHKVWDHTSILYQAWPKTGMHQEYKGYNWKNTNCTQVAALLPIPQEVNSQDEQDFNYLYYLILRALQISTPTRRVTKWSWPWWNPDLAELHWIKNTSFHDFRAGRTDKYTYHRIRNTYLWAIWKATQHHWNRVLGNTNLSSLWQMVRKALPKLPVSLTTINGPTSFENTAQVLRQAFIPDNGPPPQHQPSDSLERF